MKLSPTQLKQLDDVVRETRITRGKNAGSRKETFINVEHFDMRSFNKLIKEKLVSTSEYNTNDWYATDKGYQLWKEQQ